MCHVTYTYSCSLTNCLLFVAVQIVELAATAGLILKETRVFDAAAWCAAGYCSRGYRYVM
jgi:hypothetical protein